LAQKTKKCGQSTGPDEKRFDRAALAPVFASAFWEEKQMRKLTTAAVGAVCLVLGAGGATLYTQAATGPAIYNVYEANVTDEDAYKKALPEVQKIIKENGGVYVAGGFNKAQVDHGDSKIGNRFVIIRYESGAAWKKYWDGGGKAWIEKNAPQARSITVEGIEEK
jgi:uncharacterized protein (DUF1330 family)